MPKAFFNSPNSQVHCMKVALPGLDFASPNHRKAFALLISPEQAEAVAVHLIHTHHAISNE